MPLLTELGVRVGLAVAIDMARLTELARLVPSIGSDQAEGEELGEALRTMNQEIDRRRRTYTTITTIAHPQTCDAAAMTWFFALAIGSHRRKVAAH
jgi:hypothetical protein